MGQVVVFGTLFLATHAVLHRYPPQRVYVPLLPLFAVAVGAVVDFVSTGAWERWGLRADLRPQLITGCCVTVLCLRMMSLTSWQDTPLAVAVVPGSSLIAETASENCHDPTGVESEGILRQAFAYFAQERCDSKWETLETREYIRSRPLRTDAREYLLIEGDGSWPGLRDRIEGTVIGVEVRDGALRVRVASKVQVTRHEKEHLQPGVAAYRDLR
jgi:hypothetical protein